MLRCNCTEAKWHAYAWFVRFRLKCSTKCFQHSYIESTDFLCAVIIFSAFSAEACEIIGFTTYCSVPMLLLKDLICVWKLLRHYFVQPINHPHVTVLIFCLSNSTLWLQEQGSTSMHLSVHQISARALANHRIKWSLWRIVNEMWRVRRLFFSE